MSKTVGEFRLVFDDFRGANVGLASARFSFEDGSRALLGDAPSVAEWDAGIELLIADLRRVQEDGRRKLRAAKKRDPQPITES